MTEEKKQAEKTPEELAAERKQAEKAAALATVSLRPDTFKWNFQDKGVFDKAGLLEEIEAESETGNAIIKAVREIATEPPGQGSYQLGKRAVCLLCGAELLITKAGGGTMVCCGQNMEIRAPRPTPSSD